MEHREFRFPSYFEVTLRTRSGSVPARVVNAHRQGAKLIFTPGEIDLFSGVVLETPRGAFEADVMWLQERWIGLRFTRPLADDVVAAMTGRNFRRTPKAGQPAPFARSIRSTPSWANRST